MLNVVTYMVHFWFMTQKDALVHTVHTHGVRTLKESIFFSWGNRWKWAGVMTETGQL